MKNYRRIIYIIISCLAFAFAFCGTFYSYLSSFKSDCETKQLSMNASVQSSVGYSQTLASYGTMFLKMVDDASIPEQYAAISYDDESDSYMLNGSMLGLDFGTLYGLGQIPSKNDARNEIILAMSYSSLFRDFYLKVHGTERLYYTSVHDFVMIYPQPEDSFAPAEIQNKIKILKMAYSESSLSAEPDWSDVYVDQSGRGYTVTVSYPVYKGSEMTGVVSVDYATNTIGFMLNDKFDSFLLDMHDCIIASGERNASPGKIEKLYERLGLSENMVPDIDDIENGSLKLLGGRYYYTYKLSAAPWTLVMTLPFIYVAFRALLVSIPILIICLLLIYTTVETDKIKKAEKEIREIAVTDRLTGLKNRYFLDAIVEHEFQLADRYNHRLSIITFDLDHFKNVNDTWGHEVGDEVLKQTAKLAQNMVRKADIIARIGGEEFLILLPQTDMDGAYRVAEKIRRAMETTAHPVAGVCCASFGVAERYRGESYSELFRRADEALYNAKENGRNRVMTHDALANLLKIKWNNRWSSGDENIDKQHKELIDIANEVLAVIIINTEFKEIEKKLSDFITHLGNHCNYEEKLLMDIGYADIENHKALHAALMQKAVELKEQESAVKIEESKIVAFLINDVVVGHLLVDDVEFFSSIAERKRESAH
jgi:diguanylate cyclase (GGDEF)-like protein/hemerythrin-like metal-binding protein